MAEIKLLYQDKSVEPKSMGLNWYTCTGIHLAANRPDFRYETGVCQLTGLTKNKKPSTASIAVPIGDIPALIQALQQLYDEETTPTYQR